MLTRGAGIGGLLRTCPEDFRVEELRPQPPEGVGDHLVLTIEKIALTTDQVAEWLSQVFHQPRNTIGYAGLKDRHAVARQQFSVPWTSSPLPPELASPPPGITILDTSRQRRKIHSGQLAGNRFTIRLRNCLRTPTTEQLTSQVANQITRNGFPNYFGPQRFGHDGDNYEHGLRLLTTGKAGFRGNRHQRGLYLSAVRSELFNRILSRRVDLGWFSSLFVGDIAQLDGRSACFTVENLAAELPRFTAGTIHPTAPLFGRKLLAAQGQPAELEQAVANSEPLILRQLTEFGVDGERRAIRVIPRDLDYSWNEDRLTLEFSLPRGAYATVLIREFTDSG